LRKGHAALLAEALPRLAIGDEAAGQPAGLFGYAPREIWLEVGFGGGEHLVAQAAANPDVGLIGCEPFINGVAKALAALEALGLDNVRLRVGDAGVLFAALPPASLSKVFILYPDPWPKRRHNKRRFISAGAVESLARALRPGGELRFATDIDDYAGWTLHRLAASPLFRWTARRARDWRLPWPDWPGTRYEAKARKEGRTPVYLTFQRV
jgi:tRNA (guanine-N7-)-methyltransferase